MLEAPLYEVASDENPEATDFKGRLFRTVEEQKYLLQLTESPTNSPVLLEINKEDILGLEEVFTDTAGRKTHLVHLRSTALVKPCYEAGTYKVAAAQPTAPKATTTQSQKKSWLPDIDQLDQMAQKTTPFQEPTGQASQPQTSELKPYTHIGMPSANNNGGKVYDGMIQKAENGHYRLEGKYWYFVPDNGQAGNH
ncbi:MAG: hypothetical protein AAF990_20250 [Bacteroidota bacterium]